MQDPVYATGKFLDGLVEVPGWETGRLTEVAQAVQRSGFPEAYQQWEEMGTTLAGALLSGHPPRCRAPTARPTAGPVDARAAAVADVVRREAGARRCWPAASCPWRHRVARGDLGGRPRPGPAAHAGALRRLDLDAVGRLGADRRGRRALLLQLAV